jgi:flagellar protein FliJ
MGADHGSMSLPTFRFKLERVREVRADAEDRAREEFASSLSQRTKGIAMLREAEAVVEAAQDSQRASAHTSMTGLDLLSRQAYADRVRGGVESAEQAVSHADAEVAARRSALGDASRNREVLERLKERRRDEHRADAQRREAAELDDLATTAYVRRAAA